MASANGVSTGEGDSVASSSNGKPVAALPMILYSMYFLAILQGFYYAVTMAYDIRLYAIKEYGRVIHEFDPYFNYRATEYLWAHGWHAFSHWYDDMVWYPLGRPVGTTIYPGMQVTSVAIKQYLLPDWSINDICCFVPAWFGSIATMGTAWLAYECTQEYTTTRVCLGQITGIDWVYTNFVAPFLGTAMNTLHGATGSTWGLPHPYIRRPTPSIEAALWTALIMSIVPAHLLRSVAGGYDNESVATTAMVVTFAAWTRTLRETPHEWTTIMWGIITGICYFYMVAAWGGYVFVVNLIGVHASMLVIMGRFSGKVHKAYTSFYIVGTILATRVPVVGMTPLKSLEQLGPFVAFAGIQLLEYCRRQQVKQKLGLVDLWKLRIRVFSMAGVVALVMVFFLAPTGYFGPLSSRVRGLFVKHTKTGNPLVDSVAEHQAASPGAYFQYLNDVVYIAPVGFGLVLIAFCNDSSSFLIVYGIAAYFFSHRMVRLILLTAPIASTCGGIALGHLQGWMVGSIFPETPNAAAMWAAMMGSETEQISSPPAKTTLGKKEKAASKKGGKRGASTTDEAAPTTTDPTALTRAAATTRDPYVISGIRLGISFYIVTLIKPRLPVFYNMCDQMAQQISHPTIIQKARTKNGDAVVVDDYRDAYFWLRDNTPEDARIMAWWDYGYQITGKSIGRLFLALHMFQSIF
jgi:dolichyl-diphosphooligosaccharide---protein glycosyltransferase